MFNLICQNCGKEFTHSRNKAYCDDCESKLKTDSNTETRICLRCGKLFTVKRYDKYHYPKKKFCSDDCSKQQTKTLVCENCGKEFTVTKYPGTNSFRKVKFCSPECARVVQHKYAICENCGKKFELERDSKDQGHFKIRKYCSDACRLESQRKKIKEKQEVTLNKTIQTCQEKYGVSYPCLTDNCKNSNPMAKSKINNSFAKLLEKYNIKYIQEYRLDDYFADFYLLDSNTIIEINPTFTHSTFNNGVFATRDKNYHLNKTQHFRDAGYSYFNIWSWDDIYKIINIVNNNKEKLYARNLKFELISKQDANNFLNKYHVQNSCYGNVYNFGLIDKNDNIIQIMTFGKPRYNKNYQYELLRLCTNFDYIVLGGAEKLFKNALNILPDLTNIISYCDVSKFNGNVYKNLNFELVKQTPPQKIWSKNNNHITDNLLRQRGFDQLVGSKLNPPEVYDKGTDNEQLMLEHGWLPVYDCGQKVFVWDKEKVGL